MTVKTLTSWLLSIAMAMLVSASAMADIVECYREGPTVILKNHTVHMVFSPADSGRCVSLRMAPFGLDNELTVKPEAPTDDGELMADTFWFRQAKNLQERVYSYTTFGDARSRSIHFVIRVGSDLEFLELHKTVSLSADLDGDGRGEVVFVGEAPSGKARVTATDGDGKTERHVDFDDIHGQRGIFRLGGLTHLWVAHLTDPKRADVLVSVTRSIMHSDVGYALQGTDGKLL